MSIERVGVVGAGTMGAGIVQLAALAGYEVLLHDPVTEALDGGLARVGASLMKGAQNGFWTEDEGLEASDRVDAAEDLIELAECEFVIEAVPEDLALKRKVFAALARFCGPRAILSTNTSSLPVAEIASDISHPERLVGMHFFNPPVLMELVEIVATPVSSEHALEVVTEVAERMERTPIRAKDSPGFVANRLARPFMLEALRMLGDEVADAATIDRVCRIGGGFRMGPFELIDLIGLDVNLGIARSLYRQAGEPERWRPNPIQERMVAAGHYGRKSGQGFYRYDGSRPRPVDPELGIRAPTLSPEDLARIDPAGPEILPRLVAQIANEAAFALEEEIGSAADMNTAMRLGFHWPLGPLELTGLIGPARALQLLEELRKRHGDAYLPAPRLIAAAADSGV